MQHYLPDGHCVGAALTALVEGWDGVQQHRQQGVGGPGLSAGDRIPPCRWWNGCLADGAGQQDTAKSFLPFSEDSPAEAPPCLVFRGCPGPVTAMPEPGEGLLQHRR